MILNRTETALIGRGIDSGTAHRLRIAGWTLAQLKAANDQKLLPLGLSETTIRTLREGARPSIPAGDLIAVLFANRFLCCVCRDSSRPITVHHIESWAKSRDHSPANLAVLCTEHHSEAHTQRRLEITLSASRLRKLKTQWESEVNRIDPIAIQKATQLKGEQWLYFNHLRLFDLAHDIGINIVGVQGYQQALGAGVCDANGTVTKKVDPSDFMYSDSDGRPLYRYVKNVLRAVLEHANLRNLSDHLDRSVLRAVIVENDLIFVQGVHSFTDLEPAPGGRQPTRGVRSVNHVEVSFVFDRVEATSMSAWSLWLRGRNNVGSLIQVKQLERKDGGLQIAGTILAICASAEGLKERMYELSLYQSGIPQRRHLERNEFDDNDDS